MSKLTNDELDFLKRWFEGRLGTGRDVGFPHREFVLTFSEFLERFYEHNGKDPVFMSVNPYEFDSLEDNRVKGKLVGIERLLFEFDSQDLDLAFTEASRVAYEIRRLGADPIMNFSGRRGYHVYALLPTVITDPNLEKLKAFVRVICLKILGVTNEFLIHRKYKALDAKVTFDIARISRVPFSLHQETRMRCTPIDLEKRPYIPDLDAIHPLPKEFLRSAGEELSKLIQVRKRLSKPKALRIGARRGLNGLVLKLTEKVDCDFDGRRRTIFFLIVPRLLLSGYSEAQIVEICREFVERSGRRWSDYSYYVEDSIKRNKDAIMNRRALYSLESFLSSFPDIKLHFKRYGLA